MPASWFTFKITLRVNDPKRTFRGALRSLVKLFNGQIVEITIAPTSDEFLNLGLRSLVARFRVDSGIFTLDDLTSRTEVELRAIWGINWMTYRDIVCKLFDVGLLLADAPSRTDAIEDMDLDFWVYRQLRQARAGPHIGSYMRFNTIPDILGSDIVAMRSVLDFKGASQVQRALKSRGLALAPMFPERTLRDIFWVKFIETLEAAGLPPDTPIGSITRETLEQLRGPSSFQLLDVLISELSDVGIDLGGPLRRD